MNDNQTQRAEIREKIMRAANRNENAVLISDITACNLAFFKAGGFTVEPVQGMIQISWEGAQ